MKKSWSCKPLALVLTLTLVCNLGFVPTLATQNAADSGSAPFSYADSGIALLNLAGTVDITGMADTAAIQSSITAELAKAGISTVTVTGSFTAGNDTLDLTIPEGKTVVWKANYTSTAGIDLSGGAFTHSAGEISIANGIYSQNTRLSVTGSAVVNGGITASGGSIEVAGNARVSSPDGIAITIIPGAKNAKVTVSGGEIVSRTGIYATAEGTQITVSGGKIVSSFNCFHTLISGTQITVSGGTVLATGENGFVILSDFGITSNVAVSVTGGTMAAPANGGTVFGLTEGLGNTVAVSGGLVFASGRLSDMVPTLTGNAALVEWASVRGTTTYTTGTSKDLNVISASTTAAWATEGGKNGIRYANGTNTGFLEVPGVRVGQNATVNITGMADTAAIQSAIEAELAKANVSTVTVTGSFTAGDALNLTIPDGKLVEWKADYTCTVAVLNDAIVLKGGAFTHSAGEISMADNIISINTQLTVTGSAVMNSYMSVSGGSIEVAENARVFGPSATAIQLDSGVTVTVSGGVVSSNGSAIMVNSPDATVNVTGGRVESTHETCAAIVLSGIAKNAKVTVSGGRAVAPYAAISTFTEGAQITVSGGTVLATGDNGFVIYASTDSSNTAVSITGGTVAAPGKGGYVFIDAANSLGSTLAVSGGLMFASDGLSSVPFTLTGTAVAVKWDAAKGTTSYASGSATDLTVQPMGAARWATDGGKSGIRYVNGTNTGFFEVPGITVTGGGSSGSSSVSSWKPEATVEVVSPNVDGAGSVKAADVAKAAAEKIAAALKTGQKNPQANVLVENAKSVSPATLQELATAAKNAGGTARLLADTTANGKTQGRMYLDTALAGNLKNDVLLGITVDKTETAAVTELFQKHFGAKVAVVRLAHQGPFGMRVQIAVKADPAIDMTKPVYFYSYDRKTNKYLRIWNPAYTVDKNGWLYFYTEMGGDILYSNTLLS